MHFFYFFYQNKNMLTLIIRAIIVYLLVLLVFRLMGKRQIGQMQPFELVLTLVIADLATIPMAESAIPTLNGVVPLITLVVVHFLLTFFSKKSPKVASLISGKPMIIIDPNGISYETIEKLNITVEDIFEAIRGQGYFRLEEVQYAIMETNGVVNVMPKAHCAPVTPQDLELATEQARLPVAVISDGNVLLENFEKANINQETLDDVLRANQIKSAKEVVVLTVDGAGECYLQTKTAPFKTFALGGANE